MKIHAGQTTFTCNECALSFDDKLHLMNHRTQMHPIYTSTSLPTEKAYNCDLCYISFSNRTAFVQHKRLHSEQSRAEQFNYLTNI
jgi:hypothetical protein